MIEAAYDDAAGVTAEFNRNVLHVLNRELGADFTPEAFDARRVLRPPPRVDRDAAARAAADVRARSPRSALRVELAAGEEIRTEISAKFTRERLAADYAAAGLVLDGWHTDPDEHFALSLARPA